MFSSREDQEKKRRDDKKSLVRKNIYTMTQEERNKYSQVLVQTSDIEYRKNNFK